MELLIFDLDGTLIDSRIDLANAVNAARGHMGLSPLADEVVASYVGNGAPVLVRRAMGPDASEPDIQAALAFFLEYYADHALQYTTLYPGVREALQRLHDAGKQLAVLTNKPLVMTRTILDGLGIGSHFFRLYGGDSFPHHKPHPIGIESLMREAAVERGATMMVGDSSVDIQTARNAGVAACGVTYGFRPESLASAAPDVLVDNLEQLADRLLTP